MSANNSNISTGPNKNRVFFGNYWTNESQNAIKNWIKYVVTLLTLYPLYRGHNLTHNEQIKSYSQTQLHTRFWLEIQSIIGSVPQKHSGTGYTIFTHCLYYLNRLVHISFPIMSRKKTIFQPTMRTGRHLFMDTAPTTASVHACVSACVELCLPFRYIVKYKYSLYDLFMANHTDCLTVSSHC